TINEPDETIILTLANGSGYTVGSSAIHTFTIIDDEPSLKLTPTALTVMEGETANYDVELTSEPSENVVVTITEGSDNDLTLDSDSLTFTPQNWNIRQTVAVSADEDEDMISDRVMLTLETSGGTDDTGVLRVTIRDNDIPPSEIVEAGLVRFGRVVGEQSVSAIQDRLKAPRHIGFEGVFAGHDLSQVTSEISHQPVVADNVTPQYESQPLTTEEIVVGTSFALTQETDTGASVTFWGQGARSGFKGRQGLMNVDGDVTGFMLGWDSKYHNRLLGVMLSRNISDILYHGAATAGSLDLELTAIIPYAGWTLPNDVQVWGALGFGSGDLTRLEDEADTIHTDIDWRMVAVGAGGDLPSALIFDGADLTWHADMLWTSTSADPVADGLDGLRGKTLRQRLGMEAKWEYQLADGTIVRPSLDVGLRHDDGDAETGLGVEIGGGLEWTNPEQAPGISLMVKGRKLVIHDHDGFEDWGIRIALAYNSLPNTRRGFSSSVSHDLGGLAPEAGSVLGSDQLPGAGDFSTEDNWTAEVAYGIGQGQGRVGTPYMAVKERSSNQATRLGYRLEPDLDQDQKYRIDVWAEPGLNNGREASTSRAGLNLATRW
ncbi:MAG: autotransporter outer membrane beta-barrel domain-containing protein, partial [Paracoccaceae bacterium]|nr:autotransporter outer membrane beta-barrel domain-containing protein [Paracoccaceae bacterium]